MNHREHGGHGEVEQTAVTLEPPSLPWSLSPCSLWFDSVPIRHCPFRKRNLNCVAGYGLSAANKPANLATS